jgi:5-methylthioadenosine/S-adenosylhomocysteine deaminase
MCGLLESILSGTTSFCDPGSQRPQPTVRAVEEIGARAVLSVSLTDISGGRTMPGTFDSTTERALDAGEAFVASYAGAAGGRVRTWFSLRTERMVSDALCSGVARLAAKYGTGIFSHMISNADSVEQHRKVFGGERPIARYERNGLLGPTTQLAHCSFLEDDECDLLAERGVKVVICPTSSTVFGWGGLKRGTQLKLLERGVDVGVGSDTAACSHTLDILRIAQYFRVERDVFEDASLMPAESILEHLTIDGARAILWDDEVGSLETGKRADLLLFDLDRPEWVPLHNPISNLVHAASGANVNTVIIDGKVIVKDRRFVNIDESQVIQRGRAVASNIAERTGLTKFGLPKWPMQ